ncbi:MAG: HIRAN domain-containing protein [Isosphaeraceae bacterium]
MVIRSKVAGVTATNSDGLERQEIIRRAVKVGMEIIAIPEPQNPHDENAIGLWIDGKSKRWQIGYIKSGLADDLSGYLEEGASLSIRVLQVTGGGPGKSLLGVNIKIDVEGVDDEIDDAEDDEDDRPRGRRRKRSTVTTQATGKSWKAIQGLGCLGILGGIVLIGIGISMIDRAAKEPSPVGVFGAICLILGLPLYLFGRIGAWWFHG